MGYLVIPSRIEALVLKHDTKVSAPLADYTKLPWKSKDKKFENEAFISSTILHEPNDTMLLKKGIHLHFIVPKYLGRTYPEKKGDSNGKDIYKSLPNQWIVKRTGGGKATRSWVVTSDFVYGESEIPTNGNPTIIPVNPLDAHGNYNNNIPFRYMGRQLTLEEFTEVRNEAYYSFQDCTGNEFTVLGYGDKNFASYYPNCRGSLGFYDDDFLEVPSDHEDLKYSVLGYYRNPNLDVVKETLENIVIDEGNVSKILSEKIREKFGLTVEKGELKDVKNGVVLSAEIILDSESSYVKFHDNKVRVDIDKEKIEFGIGNTPYEALAAIVSSKITGDKNEANEEMITSLLLNSSLSGNLVDLKPRFLEERHRSGFYSVEGGSRWILSMKKDLAKGDIEKLDLEKVQLDRLELEVNKICVTLLNDLNKVQLELDRLGNKVASYRNQLLLDWQRYLKWRSDLKHVADEDKGVLEAQIKEIRLWIDHLVSEIQRIDSILSDKSNKEVGDPVTQPSKEPDKTKTRGCLPLLGSLFIAFKALKMPVRKTAAQIENSIRGLESIRKQIAVKLKTTKITTDDEVIRYSNLFELQQVPDEVFYMPKNPALVFNGIYSKSDANKITEIDKLLENVRVLNTKQSQLEILDSLSHIYVNRFSEQRWKPFLFEWNTVVQPVKGLEKFKDLRVLDNYSLSDFTPDIKFRQGKYEVHTRLMKERKFNGVTLLSDSSLRYVAKTLQEVQSRATNPVVRKFISKLIDEKEDQLQGILSEMSVLGQVMDGMHASFVNKVKAPQLPVVDPFQDPNDRLDKRVRECLKEVEYMSPVNDTFFTPIRSGNAKEFTFRFIDNFGVWSEKLVFRSDQSIISEGMRDEFITGDLTLHPRILQPARLKFDWLTPGDVPCSDIIGNNPVCGWLVPNLLENQLFVYDTSGAILGFMDSEDRWKNITNSNFQGRIKDIENAHLKKIVYTLKRNVSRALDLFQAAQQNIAPESQLGSDIGALLLGRPIAVLRASISFELKGEPLISNEFESSRTLTQLSWDQKYGAEWINALLPFRLGEYGQLNDGLVAYLCDHDGTDTLYAPHVPPEKVGKEVLTKHRAHRLPIELNDLGDEPITHEGSLATDDEFKLTLLMDPFGKINVTSGILPVTSKGLLLQWYKEAVDNMQMWFNIDSLLQPIPFTPQETAHTVLDIQELKDYKWEWMDARSKEGRQIRNWDEHEQYKSIKIINGFLKLRRDDTIEK